MPAESLAFRRELLAWTIGTLLGTIACGIAVTWLTIRFVVPDVGPWWAVLHWLRYMMFALLGGVLTGLGAMKVTSWWHHRQGVYRCWSCGRARPSIYYHCPCLPGYSERRPVRFRWWHRWRHYRRSAVPVLVAYAGIFAIDLLFTHFAKADGTPYAARLLIGHVVLCGLLGVILRLSIEIAAAFHSGRRWRLRAAAFINTFMVWPLVGIAGMIVFKIP